MLKEQLLKKHKVITNRQFYITMFVLVFCLCVLIPIIIIYVNEASDLAVMENLTLSDLVEIDDINQDYKGTTVKALEFLFKAFIYFLDCILLTIVLCSLPYTRHKQKQIHSLIEQLPDEI